MFALIATGFCDFDEGSGLVFIKSMAGHQHGHSLKINDNRVLGISAKLKEFSRNERLVQAFIDIYQGRIIKRIDENRELLEVLVFDAPEFLDKHWFLQSWIKAQDDFLISLLSASKSFIKYRNVHKEPRPWPILTREERLKQFTQSPLEPPVFRQGEVWFAQRVL